MSTPKWLIIAKSKYYTLTGGFRKIRFFFPFLIIGVLAVFIWYIASKIVGLLVDEITAFFLSHIAVATVQVILLVFFFLFISLPIGFTLKDIRIEQQWIFLKAPVKSSDILLGEFLGELPLYAILITIIAGFFTAFLNPLRIDATQKAVIVLVFVITLSSALWIGTIIAALLRTVLGKSARGKDMGKALSVVIILPFIAFMYAFVSGNVSKLLTDPATSSTVKTILGLFPSSWGADIITSFASNPGDIGAVGLEIVTRLGGLIGFCVVIVWIGVKVADRAYSLHFVTFIVTQAHPDGAFYKLIKHVGGGSFGTLLVSTFKIYARRLHNLSWLTYVVAYTALLHMFSPPSIEPDNPTGVILIGSLMFSTLAAVVASDVTIRGKESLLIYKKAPSGVGTLVKTRLIQSWLIVIPIGTVIVAVDVILIPQMTITSMLTHIGLAILMTAAYVVIALGLFLLNPVYSDKGGLFGLNVMILVLGSIGLCAICLLKVGETRGIVLLILVSWLTGIVLSLLGKRRLSRME